MLRLLRQSPTTLVTHTGHNNTHIFPYHQLYSSSIVASLLIEAPKSIKTIRQLLNSKIICYIDEVAYIRDHIEHYNEESVIKMYNKITSHPNPFVSLDKGVELVKQGGHAFYTDGNHGYQVLEGKWMNSFGMRKESNFREN